MFSSEVRGVDPADGNPGGAVRRARAWILSVLLLAVSCGPTDPGSGNGEDRIVVGSFDFSESVILAELYAQALEAEGYPVERAFELGPRELVEPSLEKGLVDLVPEYMGSALEFLNRGAGEASADVDATRRNLLAELSPRGIVAAEPALAQNVNGVAVLAETATTYGLRAISDLADVDDGFSFGGPPECPDRPLCLQGLESRYGLRFERFVPLDASGPVTVAALDAGEIDVALLFTTSGYLAGRAYVLLDDDLGLQPAENVIPVLRADVVTRFDDGVAEVLDAVSRTLRTEDLNALNRAVSLEGAEPSIVAEGWLATHGFTVGTQGT